ncbi:ABC transporter substrate-binding protein, partial [Aphanothece microscopica]|uniref:ABC transporter substrate-binding protein n=1 Tax=Aphanothece microscopica TaxID=1049561 RepID=UPI0039846193
MRGLRRLNTWLACTALALVTSVAAAQQAQPIKIGVIGPFSGPSSDFGVPMLHGIELAVEEINAVGGYLGRPLQLVIRD